MTKERSMEGLLDSASYTGLRQQLAPSAPGAFCVLQQGLTINEPIHRVSNRTRDISLIRISLFRFLRQQL